MSDGDEVIKDYAEREIRLTSERVEHILEHPEMVGQLGRLKETLKTPMFVIATEADETVHVYHRFYETTPVTSKYLQVAVKINEDDAFVLTAFFSRRIKKGERVWQA